ncbi:homeobox protein 4-like [Panonychus citri]|uniref:homeobox protein 4-like n=1 Tax=Panonychus citri TaxID=50023 RepID=UPI00230824D6|nr:homeobox protein 4-like [Panonychus citri]
MANSDDGEKSNNGISSQEQNISKSNSKMSGVGGDLGWQSSHRKLSKPNFLDLKRENHVDFLQTPDLNKVIISSPQLDSLVAQFPPTIPNLLTPALEVLPTMENVNNSNNHNSNHNASNTSVISNNINTNNNNNGPTFNNNNNNNNHNTHNSLSNGLTFKSSLLPDDDKLKLERKRERNRQAAAKCRNKKIQKITELEAKKAQLVKQRESLTENIKKYQEEIDALQRVLVERIKTSGVIDLTY